MRSPWGSAGGGKKGNPGVSCEGALLLTFAFRGLKGLSCSPGTPTRPLDQHHPAVLLATSFVFYQVLSHPVSDYF